MTYNELWDKGRDVSLSASRPIPRAAVSGLPALDPVPRSRLPEDLPTVAARSCATVLLEE
jgi:hypothetical protein